MPEVSLTSHVTPEVSPESEERDGPNADANFSSDRAAEKSHIIAIGEMKDANVYQTEESTHEDSIVTDPFVPFDDLPDEGSRIVTVRAMLVGCICGALVNASNVYLGLKTGVKLLSNRPIYANIF